MRFADENDVSGLRRPAAASAAGASGGTIATGAIAARPASVLDGCESIDTT
jgi:hypothetical protein